MQQTSILETFVARIQTEIKLCERLDNVKDLSISLHLNQSISEKRILVSGILDEFLEPWEEFSRLFLKARVRFSELLYEIIHYTFELFYKFLVATNAALSTIRS